MANIAVAVAGKVRIVESIEQKTLPVDEAVLAGATVKINVTTGKFTNSNGTSAAEARTYGIADRSAQAGETITALAKGTMDGFTFTQAYDAAIYQSDTDGLMADAAGTTSKVIGRVVPGTATTLGTAYDKLLRVEL
jgi:hypothetical protein